MFRVTKEQFEYLLHKVERRIQKQHTIMRQPIISARTKLEITLKYLATGDSFQTLTQLFRVPTSTISTFLVDVLQSIYNALEEYIKVPKSTEEWSEIIREFDTRWNIPNCTGAIDGNHVIIKCPSGSGSEFFNYKHSFSLVLLAVVDYDYCFLYIDVGAKGRNSDGGIFSDCSLKKAIEMKSLNLPDDSVFVGDEAFPLKKYLLKPYPRRVALKRLPNFIANKSTVDGGLMPHHQATIHINCEDCSLLNNAYEDARKGLTPIRPMIEMVLPSSLDSTIAPKGAHVCLLFTQFTPYHLTDGQSWSQETKELYATKVFNQIEEYAPGFQSSVIEKEVLSPPDIERLFSMTGGNIFHGALHLHQMLFGRPMGGIGCHSPETSIQGLLLCGAGAHPGGGVTGAPGRLAALHALNYNFT